MTDGWTRARRPHAGQYVAPADAALAASRARVAAAVDALDHVLAPTTPELAAVLEAERAPRGTGEVTPKSS